MRSLFLLAACFLLLDGLTNATNAQQIMASDTTTLPFSVGDVVSEIKAYVETPSAQNEYLKYILDEEGFPEIQVGNAIDPAIETQIAKWVRNNPDKVSRLLYERKKNYDKFHN